MSTPFNFTQQHQQQQQPTNSYAEFNSNIFASPSSTTTMTYQPQPPKGVTGKTQPNDKKPLPDSEYEFRFEVREAGVLPLPRGQHRSRASCDYCRQRHWRCDNQRPTCAHCVKMGVQCTYLNPRKKRGRIPKNAIRTPPSGTPTTTNPKRKTEIESKRPRSTSTKEKTPAKKQKTNNTSIPTPNKRSNKSTSNKRDDDDYEEEEEDEDEDEMEEDEDEVVEYQAPPKPAAPHPQLVPSISVTNPNNNTIGNFGGSVAMNPTSLAAELAGYGFMSQADPNWDELFNENTDTNSGGEFQGGRLTTSAIQRILKLSGSRLFSSYNNAPQATITSSSFSSLNAPGGTVPLDVPSSPIWLLSPPTPTPNNLSTSAANAAAFAAAAVTISEIMGLSSSGDQRQQQTQQQQQQQQGQQQLLPPSQPFRGVLGSSGGRYPIRQQTNSSGGWEEESVLSANTLFTDLNASATTPTPSNLLNNSDIAFLRSVLSLSGSNSNAPASSHPSTSSSTVDPSGGAGITYSSDQRPLRISSSAERILRLLGVSLGNNNNTNRVERRRQQRIEEGGTTTTTTPSSTTIEAEKNAPSTTGTPTTGPTSLVDPIAELGVELPSPNITKPTRALANSGIHMRRTASRVRRSDPDSDPLSSPSLSLSSGDSSSTSTASSAATTPLPPTSDKLETTASPSPSADSPGFEERQQQYGQLRPQQLPPPFKIDTLYAPLGLNGNTEELKVPEDKCNSYLKWFEEHLGLLWNHLAVPPLTSYLKFALSTTNTNLPPPSLLIAEEIQLCARLAFGARAIDGAEISSKFSNRAMMLLDICARQIFQTPPCRETRTAPEGDLSGGTLAVFIGLAEGLILWHEYWIACNQFDAIRHFQPFLIRLWDDLSFAYMIPSTSNAEKNQVIARILLRLAGHEQLLARLAGNEVEEMYEFALTIASLVTPIDHTFLFVFRTMARINALENLNEALWCTDKLQEAFEEWETKEVPSPFSGWLLPGIAFCLSAAKALIYDKTKMPRLSEKWCAKAHLQLKSPHFNLFFPAVGCCVAFLFTLHLKRKEYEKVEELLDLFAPVAAKFPSMRTQLNLVTEFLNRVSDRPKRSLFLSSSIEKNKKIKSSSSSASASSSTSSSSYSSSAPTSTSTTNTPSLSTSNGSPSSRISSITKPLPTPTTEQQQSEYPYKLHHLISVILPYD